MAENKKSFILYADQRGTFDKLNNEQAGLLIKHIYAYVNDENPSGDFITELAFEPIKTQLKRDLIKWEHLKGKRSEAGKASAEARANKKQQTSTNPTSVKSVQQTSTNPTVNVNDNVNVNVNVNVNDIIKKELGKEFIEIVNLWLKYKKEKKQAYKETGLKMFLTKLKKYSKSDLKIATEIIEKSITNNYAGIFELNKPQQDKKPMRESDYN